MRGPYPVFLRLRSSAFVMGDGRDDARDGRFWGFLSRRSLQAAPLAIYHSYDLGSRRPLPLLTATRGARLFAGPR
jgi:hypothetical protein